MAKFHINGNGEAGACRAGKGGCPFGDDSKHFTSAEAARVAYEERMNRDTPDPVQKSLPNFEELYNEAPRGNIGFAKAVSDLKGLQRDLDAGFVKSSEVLSHIARIADNTKRIAAFSDRHKLDSSESTARAAYIKKLRRLSHGAKPAQLLHELPHWREALSAMFDAEVSKAIPSDKRYAVMRLRDRLNGEGVAYEGYSEKETLEKAKNLRDSLARARNPKLLLVASKLEAALTIDGRLS